MALYDKLNKFIKLFSAIILYMRVSTVRKELLWYEIKYTELLSLIMKRSIFICEK